MERSPNSSARHHIPPLLTPGSSWVMNGVRDVYVDRTAVGWGLFANHDFSKDSEVFRFTGKVLDLNSTLSLGQWSFYSVQIDANRYLDVEPPGAFINHSCDPNCGIRDSDRLVALEDIKAGEELLMDYSTCIGDGDPETMACRCGSAGCRGKIADFFSLPVATQRRYLALNIVSGFITRDPSDRPQLFEPPRVLV